MKQKTRKKRDRTKLELQNVDWSMVEKLFQRERKELMQNRSEKEKSFLSSKDCLKLLAAGVVIGLSLMVPTAPMALAPFFLASKRFTRHRLHQTVNRLKKQKLVEIVYQDGYTVVRITHNGRMQALAYKLDELQVEKPTRWDGKWRVVIFDIPEKRKRLRDIFRKRLQLLGFYQLQESVWVHPYPCRDQIEFLRQIYSVDVSVRYIVAETIEDTNDLLLHFDLRLS